MKTLMGKKVLKAHFYKWGGMTEKIKIKSVGVKLFLIFLLSVSVFSTSVGLLSYHASKTLIKEEVGAFSTIATIEMADKLKMVYENYEKLMVRLMLEQQFKDGFKAFKEATDTAGQKIELDNFRKLLQGTAFNDKYVKTIKIIDPNGKLLTSVGSEIAENDTRTKDHYADYKALDWYDAAIKANGDVIWLPTQPNGIIDDGAPSFALTRAVKDVYGKIDYVLLLEVHYAAIREPFNTFTLKDGAQKLVINSNNRVIYSDLYEEVGKPSLLNNPIVEGENHGASESAFRNEKFLVSYARSMNSNDWFVVTAIPEKQLTKNAGVILLDLMIVLAVAIVFAILLGVYMLFSIGGPLTHMKMLMARGEKGELSVRSDLKRQDEIGQLGTSFNNMMERITYLIVQVKASVEQVKANAEHVHNVSQENAVVAKEVAVSMEGIAEGSYELALLADEGYESASVIREKMDLAMVANKVMGATAGQVLDMSNNGVLYMEQLVENTKHTETKTHMMFSKVDALKESTGSIRKVLDLLNGITKQTNILSLNASIEASRAGESGKGFMVIANEIRKLAYQSKDSIIVVDDITQKIEKEAFETIQVIHDVRPLFERQLKLVSDTDQLLKEVHQEMMHFIEQLNGVNQSIEQLGESQQRIAVSISSVSAVAEQSSATTEEVLSITTMQSKTNDELVQLSIKLKRLSDSVEEALGKFHY